MVENGGIVNKMGAYTMGIVARDPGKPFYVTVESYTFTRLFLLNQWDLNEMRPESRLRFVDTAIWEFTGGVVVGTYPLLRDWILLCEIRRGSEK